MKITCLLWLLDFKVIQLKDTWVGTFFVAFERSTIFWKDIANEIIGQSWVPVVKNGSRTQELISNEIQDSGLDEKHGNIGLSSWLYHEEAQKEVMMWNLQTFVEGKSGWGDCILKYVKQR